MSSKGFHRVTLAKHVSLRTQQVQLDYKHVANHDSLYSVDLP